jgi:hypothetical protein
MRQQIKPETSKYRFDSLPEYSQWLKATPKIWQHNSSQGKRDYDWDLGAGYDKACDLARYGWIEGAQAMQDSLKAFTPMSVAPDTLTDFYGHRPHVARYCAGAPDNMLRYDREGRDGSGRVVTLLVPIAVNCHTQAECFTNFGVGVVQYINQLETDGLRVEVHSGIALEYNMHRMTCTTQIKSADQQLDLAVVAFAIGHPAMFRRLGFAMIERSALPETGGYGGARDMDVSDMLDAPNGLIVLNGATKSNSLARTPEDAFKYVGDKIEDAMKQQQKEKET